MEAELARQVDEARKVVRNGGTVIYPTETAYGIAADALDPEAVEKVYEMKQRPQSKGLTVIVKDLDMAEKYAGLDEAERKLFSELMPGPLTLVAEKKDSVPDILNEKFVFRISSGEVASALAEDGPVTATSANLSGHETSYSPDDIDSGLRQKADYLIDEGQLEYSPTSTIVELEDGLPVLHREGAIKTREIKKVLDDR